MKPFLVDYLFIATQHLLHAGDRITAQGASVRLGSLAPTYALTDLGYDARTISLRGDPELAESAVRNARRVVFGEMFRFPGCWDAYRRLLRLVPNPADKVIFTIADDHFRDAEVREFYAEFLPRCLAVTTASERLAQVIGQFTSRPVLVAPEPYEGARGAPHAIGVRRPAGLLNWLARRIGVSSDVWRARLLWFGYPMNLAPLLELLPELEALSREVPLVLNLVTQPAAEIEELLSPERTSENASLRLQFTQWTPTVLQPALAYCDLVLLPTEYRNPAKHGKSPNRLVSGIHGGRLVVAHPLPAYVPYAEYAWIGEDLCEGLRWALSHPREAVDRITRGQAYIDTKHSPEVIARFWLDVFDLAPQGG